MLIENIIDLDDRRNKKNRVAAFKATDYVNNELDHFVSFLIDNLEIQGIDKAKAEKLIAARMSDLTLAFDLKNS